MLQNAAERVTQDREDLVDKFHGHAKKVVSHDSSDAEVISLGTGPWLEGPPLTPT